MVMESSLLSLVDTTNGIHRLPIKSGFRGIDISGEIGALRAIPVVDVTARGRQICTRTNPVRPSKDSQVFESKT